MQAQFSSVSVWYWLVLLLLLLLLLVGKGVAARGGNLKKNKLEGGWGGGRSASPPDALDVLASLQPNSFRDQHETPRIKTQGH